ncbi:MAG: restriction endonuclease subunit S [Verrucomicrobiales bacterium]|nr:restriction endonuclease subunit S [Verrucomicrobiales bacterium]
MKRILKKLAKISSGYQTRKGVEECSDGSHYLLQIRDFNKSRTSVEMRNMVRISPPGMDPDAHLREGDVLFLAKGQKNFAWCVGRLPNFPILAASYFFVLRPLPEILGEYLSWFLSQEPAQQHFARLATTGAHMPIIRRDVLESLEVSVPDLATQCKIVEIADLAEEQGKLLAELAEKKKALATAACLRATDGRIRFSNKPS